MSASGDTRPSLPPVTVAGLRLPEELLRVLVHGRFCLPDDDDRIESMFPYAELSQPMLVGSLNRLVFENQVSLGGAHLPAGIDPRRALCIGFTSGDLPIILDYRSEPVSIAYIATEPTLRWMSAAHDISAFLAMIGAS